MTLLNLLASDLLLFLLSNLVVTLLYYEVTNITNKLDPPSLSCDIKTN